MQNLGELASTVQKNCHISDARYAGELTLCVFLIKMREYYRWELNIPFAAQIPKESVSEWLREREQVWERLSGASFERLPLASGRHDPFDAETVNRELLPRGYVYGGGYGRAGKPIFFLAELARTEERDGCTVHVSTCEYARDLEAPPAMLQGQTIYVRQESLRRYLWEKIEDWRWNRKAGPMQEALSAYGFRDDDLDGSLARMTAHETESVILHELGEARAGALLGPDWETMLGALARSRFELTARAVRDLLADCLSTLPELLAREAHGALHFYFATFSGLRRELFPELLAAYQRWADGGEAKPLLRLAHSGAQRWREIAEELLALYRQRGADETALASKLRLVRCQS
jgi:hypothetical protein